MSLNFPLFVSYAQVAVFPSSLERPFNYWTDRHVAQGFSWRSGSASFAVPDGGNCLVEILQSEQKTETVGEILREIWVPFDIVDRQMTCGSITDEKEFCMPLGMHQLVFKCMRASEHTDSTFEYFLSFMFFRTEKPHFACPKFDKEAVPYDKFLLSAEPAE
jgi:hypothetical protein